MSDPDKAIVWLEKNRKGKALSFPDHPERDWILRSSIDKKS